MHAPTCHEGHEKYGQWEDEWYAYARIRRLASLHDQHLGAFGYSPRQLTPSSLGTSESRCWAWSPPKVLSFGMTWATCGPTFAAVRCRSRSSRAADLCGSRYSTILHVCRWSYWGIPQRSGPFATHTDRMVEAPRRVLRRGVYCAGSARSAGDSGHA